jgi:hypothetical protein
VSMKLSERTTLLSKTPNHPKKAMGDTMNSPQGTPLSSVTFHPSTCTIFLEIRLMFPLFGNYVVRFDGFPIFFTPIFTEIVCPVPVYGWMPRRDPDAVVESSGWRRFKGARAIVKANICLANPIFWKVFFE